MAVVQYRRLLDLLFPIGLAVTKLPYVEEFGSAVTLEKAVKPEVRAKLAALQMGPDRLVDHFDAWMKAARDLGEVVKERADLSAASTRDGSNGEWSDIKAGRMQWISAVRGLLWTLDREPKLAKLRESVVTGIQRSVAIAFRRAALPAGAEVNEEELEAVELEAAAPFDDDDFGTDTVAEVGPEREEPTE